jgi:hypothetical protein
MVQVAMISSFILVAFTPGKPGSWEADSLRGPVRISGNGGHVT